MLVKFQPLLKTLAGCKPQKMTNSCFRDFQTALVIDRCRKSVDNNLIAFFRESQPLITCYIDRALRGGIPLKGGRLFQEIFSNDRRSALFAELRHDIQQLISRYFHIRSFELAMVTARLDDLMLLQQLCRPTMAESVLEYYYSYVTVTVATNLANRAFAKALNGFALPWMVTEIAETVEWGSIWMAAAGFKPAVEKRRCAVFLDQAIQGLVINWQLTIKQELFSAVTTLLYDIHDQAVTTGIYGKARAQSVNNHHITQPLRQAI